MNIVDAILFQAKHQPTALAVCAPGSRFNVVSYGRLADLIRNMGAHALSAGLRRGNIVAVSAADPVLHLSLVLALTKLGVVNLSLGAGSVPADLAIDAVVCDRPGQFGKTARVIVGDWMWTMDARPGPPALVEPELDAGAATARIVLTSGTTGNPKAVALTHDMMIRRLQAYDSAFGNVTPTCTRTFLDLGLAASFGYTWAIHILTRGGAIFYRGADPAETMHI